MSAPQLPPAGWYDDPEDGGGQRWWNGTAWTDHHRAPGTFTTGANVVGAPAADHSAGLDDRTWVTLAHASALLAAWVGVAFVGPLIVYLLRRDDSPAIRAHAAAALNFQLSWLIWGIALGVITFILAFILVGLLLIPVLVLGAIAWLVITIMASIKASQGGPPMRYPLTISFVN